MNSRFNGSPWNSRELSVLFADERLVYDTSTGVVRLYDARRSASVVNPMPAPDTWNGVHLDVCSLNRCESRYAICDQYLKQLPVEVHRPYTGRTVIMNANR